MPRKPHGKDNHIEGLSYNYIDHDVPFLYLKDCEKELPRVLKYRCVGQLIRNIVYYVTYQLIIERVACDDNHYIPVIISVNNS